MEAKRCHIHGLVLGADRRCVICRRDDSELGDARSPGVGSAHYIAALLAALGAAAVALVIYRVATDEDGEVPGATPDAEVSTQEQADETADEAAPARATPRPRPPPVAALQNPESPLAADDDTQERIQSAMKNVEVTMYSTAWCDLCQRANRWFKKNGFRVRELDIDKSETDKILLRSINPAASVPTFDVEGRVLIGYSESSLEEAILQAAEKKVARQ